MHGLKNEGLLHSALGRPANKLAYAEPDSLDLFDLAAAYVKRLAIIGGRARHHRRFLLALGDNGGDLDALDRGLGPAERSQDCLLDQSAAVFIRWCNDLLAHNLFSQGARRHGLERFAQQVVDQPQAFARMKPGAAGPPRLRARPLRHEVWIEQPHSGVEMNETGTIADDLLLQMAHDPAQLGSLPAQSVNNVRLGPRNSPSWIKVQDGNRTTPPLGTRPWWQLLHDTEKCEP